LRWAHGCPLIFQIAGDVWVTPAAGVSTCRPGDRAGRLDGGC